MRERRRIAAYPGSFPQGYGAAKTKRSRQLAVSGKTIKKLTHLEEVIPMKDEGFKDF